MYLTTWYKRVEGVDLCMHELRAGYTAGPHSVTVSEVPEVQWTGRSGIGSVVSLLNATFRRQNYVVTWDGMLRLYGSSLNHAAIILTFTLTWPRLIPDIC